MHASKPYSCPSCGVTGHSVGFHGVAALPFMVTDLVKSLFSSPSWSPTLGISPFYTCLFGPAWYDVAIMTLLETFLPRTTAMRRYFFMAWYLATCFNGYDAGVLPDSVRDDHSRQ